MIKQTIFYLTRHGQTQWNLTHRIQGQLDSPLTIKGQQQALQLANLSASLNISQILCSCLGRTTDTAKICASQLDIPWKVLDGIQERNFGTWQGKLTEQVRGLANYNEITAQVTDCKPECGESALQLLTRFENALISQFEQLPDARYLIVTHGDVLRCFMDQFLPVGHFKTGYDYPNGQLIGLCYQHSTGCFKPL